MKPYDWQDSDELTEDEIIAVNELTDRELESFLETYDDIQAWPVSLNCPSSERLY